MDYWRAKYLLPAIRSKQKIALIGIGDNPRYWEDSSLESLADIWDPARLASSSSNYCVFDIDSSLVEKAKQRGIQSKVCDLTRSPLPEEYERIFASDVIEHVRDPQAFIGNLKQSLLPGGSLVITTPNALYWRNFLTGFRNEHPEHMFCFGRAHLQNLCQLHGLQLTECCSFQAVGLTSTPQRLLLPLHRLFASLGRGNSLLARMKHS